MTDAPETGGARKLASVSGAGFSRQLQNFGARNQRSDVKGP